MFRLVHNGTNNRDETNECNYGSNLYLHSTEDFRVILRLGTTATAHQYEAQHYNGNTDSQQDEIDFAKC